MVFYSLGRKTFYRKKSWSGEGLEWPTAQRFGKRPDSVAAKPPVQFHGELNIITPISLLRDFVRFYHKTLTEQRPNCCCQYLPPAGSLVEVHGL